MMPSVPGFSEVAPLGDAAAGPWLARHDSSGLLAVIRRLPPELASDVRFRARFAAAAAALQEMRHPNVVGLYEVLYDDGALVTVSEFCDALPVRRLCAGGPLPVEAALVVLRGVLLGMERAHSAGVVDGDHRPDRTVVTTLGQVRLADVAVPVPPLRGGEVQLPGAPEYRAPEVWETGEPGVAADLYAATVTFFEMLTGYLPYQAREAMVLRAQHEAAPIPEREVPDGLRRLLRRGLDKEPLRRFADAAAYRTALEATAQRTRGADWDPRGRSQLASAVLALAEELPSRRFAELAGEVLASPAPAAGVEEEPAPAVPAPAVKNPYRDFPDPLRRRPLALGVVGAAAGLVVLAATGLAVTRSGPFSRAVSAPTATSDGGTAPVSAVTTPPLPAAAVSPPPTAVPTPTPTGAPSPSAGASPSPSPTPRTQLHVDAAALSVNACVREGDGSADCTFTATFTVSGASGSESIDWRLVVSQRGCNGAGASTLSFPYSVRAAAGSSSVPESVTVHFFADIVPGSGSTAHASSVSPNATTSASVLVNAC